MSPHLYLFKAILLLLYCVYSSEGKQPNILFILTDDMGTVDVSYNYKLTNSNSTKPPPILTPNIDHLAENGIIFNQHYVQEICAPTRCALLTSKFPFRTGSPFPSRDGEGGLPPKIPTFVHELKKRGYKSHMVGKYGVDNHGRVWNSKNDKWEPKATYNDELGPLARGFDTFYGLYFSAHNHYSKKTVGTIDWHKFNSTHLLDAPADLDTEPNSSSTYLFTRETINLINLHMSDDEYKSSPFFIYLPYSMPHDPLQVDPKYYSKEKYPHCYNKPNHRRRTYCGMMMCVDEGIGNITNHLKQNKLLDDTIIIFSSDNGGSAMVGGFNYPLRGGKGSVFEGGIRSAAFIYSPSYFPLTSGKIYPHMMHIVDWGPTLLSLIDYNSTTDRKVTHTMGLIDGMDLSFSLQNFDHKTTRNEAVLIHDNWRNSSSIISGDYKLILGYTGPDWVYHEPDTVFAMAWEDKDIIWYFINIINDGISYFLGPDFFLFEWANLLIGSKLHDFFDGSFIDFNNKHANGPAKSINDIRPMHLPFINWTHPIESKKIRLYNIKEDITEFNNIAFKNKDIVLKLFNILNDHYLNSSKNEYIHPQHGAKFYLMGQMMDKLYIVFFAVIAIIFGIFLKCCMMFKKSSGKSDKRKRD